MGVLRATRAPPGHPVALMLVVTTCPEDCGLAYGRLYIQDHTVLSMVDSETEAAILARVVHKLHRLLLVTMTFNSFGNMNLLCRMELSLCSP